MSRALEAFLKVFFICLCALMGLGLIFGELPWTYILADAVLSAFAAGLFLALLEYFKPE